MNEENEPLTIELEIIHNLIAEYSDLVSRHGKPEFAPKFIRHAFTSLTLLITEVETLQAENARLRVELQQSKEDTDKPNVVLCDCGHPVFNKGGHDVDGACYICMKICDLSKYKN